MEESRQSPDNDGAGEITEEEERRLRSVVDLFSRLSIACKSRSLYAAKHPTAIDAVVLLHAVMEDSLRITPGIAVKVGKDSLIYEKWVVGQRMGSLRALASRIRSLNIQEISISAGASFQEAEALVDLLVSNPEEVDAAGGPETFLLSKGVQGIAVVESEAQRVEEEEEEKSSAVAGLEPTPEGMELADVVHPEQFRDLLKLLLNPEELGRVLMMLSGEGGQPLGKEGLADAAFTFLRNAAAIVADRHAERMQECLRSMAESLLFLDIDVRNLLLLRGLLPRLRDEPVCTGILNQFNAQEIADVLSSFLPLVPELTPRAGSLLKAIGFREAEIRHAVRLLRAKLVDLGQISHDLLASLDTGLESGMRERQPTNKLPTLEEVVSILGEYRPEELEEIRLISHFDPATDMLADTTPMLLDLLRRVGSLDNAVKVVELLQQNFWGLTMSAELDMAALVLEETRDALRSVDPAMDPFRPALNRMIEEATSDKVTRQVIRLACSRREKPGVMEGLRRYMAALDEKGVAAMVETLGSEEDMSLRKGMMEALTELGRDRIPLLGAYVDDPRWFLVRNIVSILARYRSPEAIPYLQRTLDHPNPKVKAETVRALGLMGDYGACELLIRGLQDDEERIRILCIRWLGRLEEARAVPRLVKMLEDKEPGAESPAVKKEIVRSLGEIKAPESYDVLKKYRAKQKRLARAEWQEVNQAAADAMQRLTQQHPHLGRRR